MPTTPYQDCTPLIAATSVGEACAAVAIVVLYEEKQQQHNSTPIQTTTAGTRSGVGVVEPDVGVEVGGGEEEEENEKQNWD